MAFSETQKDQIRRYLGYPAGFRDYDTLLESMMDTIGANAIEQASVEAILTELATVDAVFATTGARSYTTGALKQVDEIEFYNSDGALSQGNVNALNRGKMLIQRLAQRFGVTPANNYFGTGGAVSGYMPLG